MQNELKKFESQSETLAGDICDYHRGIETLETEQTASFEAQAILKVEAADFIGQLPSVPQSAPPKAVDVSDDEMGEDGVI